MDKIFICSPYRGDVKKNIENVKRYCSYFSYEGIPIAPHLYFTQFLDERYDRYKGMRWGKALLAEVLCIPIGHKKDVYFYMTFLRIKRIYFQLLKEVLQHKGGLL